MPVDFIADSTKLDFQPTLDFQPDEKDQEKEQEEILSRPAVPAYVTEHGERPDYTGAQLTASDPSLWQRFRNSELGRKLLGTPAIEREGMVGPGTIGLLEIPQKLLQFTSVPPPIANPIRQEIESSLARTDQSPTFKGLVRGGAELVLNLPLAPIPAFPKTVLAAFGAEYAFHLPEQRQAYKSALERGDLEEATKIATEAIGGGALLAFGAAHQALHSTPPASPEVAIASEVGPATTEAVKEIIKPTEVPNASEIGKTEEVISTLPAQPVEGVKEVPTEISPEGIPGSESAQGMAPSAQGPTDKGIAASARAKLAEKGEEGFINIGPAFQALQEKRNVVVKQLAGESAPKTSNASEESGNKLVRYASAKIAAPEIAKYKATEVMGDHYQDSDFSQKLGAVLVEDNLRGIKQAAIDRGDTAAANAVTSIIGKPDSPFATEADYRAALSDPEIQAAIQRHKSEIQPLAELYHQEAGGTLRRGGLETGAFINLKAEGMEDFLGSGGRGNVQNPLRRLSRFSKQAKGTAAGYELDYRTLAERQTSANYEEFTKRQLYDQMIADGLAKLSDPGDPVPDIGGKPAVRFTIERKGAPMGTTASGEARARTYVKYFDVRSDLASEVRQALNIDGPIGKSALVAAADLLNKIQLAGPTDAVWHTANMFSSIAGSQGGKTLLNDLVRKLPGVNVADATGRMVAKAIEVIRDTPEVQSEIAELARIGALRSEREISKLAFNRRLIGLFDKAGRLVRNEMYQNLVDRGLVKESEAGRREWVNQLGQYNGRLMSQLERFFKEAGFSPFVVAGRNFNRMAWRRMTFSPGVEGKTTAAAFQMRAIEAFGTIATLIVIPSLINYAVSGDPNGRPGVKMGQIDTGKTTDDGKAIVIDPAQWTGLRRGLRISGAQAIIEGNRRGESVSRIRQEMLRDQLGGILHPWTGPAVSAAEIARSGKSPTGFQESKNPKDYGENVKAALKQLNPVVEGILAGHEKGGGGNYATKPITGLAGAAGVKEIRPTSASELIAIARDKWMEESSDPKIRHLWETKQTEQFPESDYKGLRDALRSDDRDKATEEYQKLRELGKTPKDIREYFERKQPEGSTELRFKASLTPDQRRLYRKAQEERRQMRVRFRQFDQSRK